MCLPGLNIIVSFYSKAIIGSETFKFSKIKKLVSRKNIAFNQVINSQVSFFTFYHLFVFEKWNIRQSQNEKVCLTMFMIIL